MLQAGERFDSLHQLEEFREGKRKLKSSIYVSKQLAGKWASASSCRSFLLIWLVCRNLADECG